MDWCQRAVEEFTSVANLAGVPLLLNDFDIKYLPAPHTPPSRLPPGKMAVYVLLYRSTCLKAGKARPKSQARYTSQHYNPKNAASTLAAAMIADQAYYLVSSLEEDNVGQWIKDRVDRVNFILDDSLGMATLTLLEAFLQCRLMPRYEGFKSQRQF